ncbi:MAG: methyltransferase domain-containing protein [Planctomycetaceae bacterium]|nr:methyltransferase domain-containing protein [Planctomycetaceae bacterium]
MSITHSGPAYFERLIEAFRAGQCSRAAHLGHWDQPPENGTGVSADQFAAAQRRLTDQMIARAELVDKRRILDVGCGFGGLLEQVDQQLRGGVLTGVNIDWQQLEICQELRSQHGNTFRWQEADACDLPFDDASFDVLFCVEAMFHFSSRKRFLAEARRCLVTGGRLVVSDFVLTAEPSLPGFAIAAVLQDGYGPWPDPWCEDGTAADLLRDDNWTQIELTDATQATLPSYQFVAPSQLETSNVSDADAATRSVRMLQWLQQRDYLRYEYVTAVKGAA